MTVKEAINRGINFLGIAISGIAGFDALEELFGEKDSDDKVEDIIFLLFVITSFIWYRVKGHALKRTIMPGIFLICELLTVVLGFVIYEKDDPNAYGPDIGKFFILLLGIIIFFWQYVKFRKEQNTK